MAALSGPRNTQTLDAKRTVLALPMEAHQLIYQGAQVSIDAYGNACAASLTSGTHPLDEQYGVGMALETQDNSSGAAGALKIQYLAGFCKWDNDTGTAVTQADVGEVCYMLDDHTVTGASSNHGPAGIVYQVDSDGVWVDQSLGSSAKELLGG